MRETRDVRTDLRALLDAIEGAPPVDAVEALALELARMVDAQDVTFLIADFSGNALIRFLSASNGHRTSNDDQLSTVPLPGSPHEDAMRSQQVRVDPDGELMRLYAPVTDRGDAMGVLEMALPYVPTDEVLAFIGSAAHALAYVVIANRRHTDLFERGQRWASFSLAAEIQRRLLPAAFTCEAAAFTFAGWLEPASDIGGDTFDYTVERDALHVSISDAMGHTVKAAQLATLAVSSLRNSRRSHASVVEQAEAANAAITDFSSEDEFVSGLLLRIDFETGEVDVVNAGHPTPYLARGNEVTDVHFEADLPFGMMSTTTYREQSLTLQPGDRLVLVTDGMLERNAASIDIESALSEMGHLHPREVVHSFAQAVVGATGGDLEDDATVVCIDWYGPGEGNSERVLSADASQSRATWTHPE